MKFEILQGNHMIGTFHGWKHIPTPKGTGKGYYDFPGWGKASWNLDSFQYHSSWDWIMAAVKKFLDQYDKKNTQKLCESLRFSLYHASIDNIFQTLCLSLHHINSNKYTLSSVEICPECMSKVIQVKNFLVCEGFGCKWQKEA